MQNMTISSLLGLGGELKEGEGIILRMRRGVK